MANIPRFAVFRADFNSRFLRYVYEDVAEHGHLSCTGQEIFHPSAKFALEPANDAAGFVNIRSCFNNKYWQRNDRGFIQPLAEQPQEDQSSASCTLFQFSPSPTGGEVKIRHVQSNTWLSITNSSSPNSLLIIITWSFISSYFTMFDWDTLVILPKHVAFKGYNDKYLRAAIIETHEYLRFNGDEKGELAAAYEVTMNPDGFVRIKSRHFDKFWRRSPNWIWADSTDTTSNNRDTLFWPVKVNDNTIALRNAGNDRFCSSLTTEGKVDCLNAATPTITTLAQLQVEELVFEREIYDVRYRVQDARVYNETVFVAGTGSATNNTQNDATYSITVSYEDSRSYSWSNTISVSLGITHTFEAGIPFIIQGKVEISAQVQNSFEWGQTTTETKRQEAKYEGIVPAMSSLIVNYVATRATCDVPFSYTQRDRSSVDGSYIITQKDDGIYTGVNYYSFHFDSPLVRRLSEEVEEQN